jgi:hypothetical protein
MRRAFFALSVRVAISDLVQDPPTKGVAHAPFSEEPVQVSSGTSSATFWQFF